MAGPHPTPLEVTIRLEALRARLESTRATDDHLDGIDAVDERDADETPAGTLARLRVLEARLRAMGGSVP